MSRKMMISFGTAIAVVCVWINQLLIPQSSHKVNEIDASQSRTLWYSHFIANNYTPMVHWNRAHWHRGSISSSVVGDREYACFNLVFLHLPCGFVSALYPQFTRIVHYTHIKIRINGNHLNVRNFDLHTQKSNANFYGFFLRVLFVFFGWNSLFLVIYRC